MVIALLIAAIGVTIALGDRAGVGVLAVSPLENAHTTTPVRIVFSEVMNHASVESNFHTDPALEGRFEWNGSTLLFRPRVAWIPGTQYTITINPSAESERGRKLVQAVTLQFEVEPTLVAYLAPAVLGEGADVPNLWIVDPLHPDSAKQITFAGYGVLDYYHPSPDGTLIAYSKREEDGTANLYTVDLQTGENRQLTNCVAASCQSPAWSPDGTRIAYERVELNRELPQFDQGAPRTWIVNIRDLNTAPLFSNSQILGGSPRWSPDGQSIAVYDRNLGAIAIYHLASGERQLIETLEGITGGFAFDPTGTWMVFPRLSSGGGIFYTKLSLADLTRGSLIPLSPADAPIEDIIPAWNPATGQLAMTRRLLDGSGRGNALIYTVDPETPTEATLLIGEDTYYHGAISWDSTGQKLVMLRAEINQAEPEPGIWVYDALSESLTQIASDAYLPQWIP